MGLLRDKVLSRLLNPEIEKFLNIEYLDGPIDIDVIGEHKLSICTTCMNREHDLEQTFLKNIKDNSGYKNLEFVLLNYNSQDELDKWALKNLKKLISKGIVNYYKTVEPQFYSMTHSRNVAFKLANGDIVSSVDADHFINPGFCARINELAIYYKAKAVFVKSRQKNRGRLTFFKKEFMDVLNGYDEGIRSYGFDDQDILLRAVKQGFKVVRYGGEYYGITSDHKRHPVDNYCPEDKDWKYTQRRNTVISILNLLHGRLQANVGSPWGKAHLIKNFEEEVAV